VQPQPGDGDPRIQMVDYDAHQIVAIRAAAGYQVTIEFAADERIENVAVGDSGAWQATPNRRGDHVFVKLLRPEVATNMTVVTDVRVYLFDLVPLYGASPDMAYTVRFRYPTPDAGAGEEVAEARMIEGRYRLSGDRALRPSGISDDGLHTYIEWPRDRALPAVYGVDSAGRESLVNGMMRGEIFVIDAVMPRLVFRIDQQVARAVRVADRLGRR
jgi:type IV secretion system protein VirB9